MELSVVVPTLDGRERVGRPLDALAGADAEVVVVNGPSTDGTAGLVRDHPAVDRLVEVAERNLAVARNAGVEQSTGGAVAFLADGSAPEGRWLGAIGDALADGADAVTGPVHRSVAGGVTTETEESRTVAGRAVTFFDGGNVALTRTALDALDGFDEYLAVGSARDAAHRLAGMGYRVAWHPAVAVRRGEARDPAARFADTGHDDGPAWGRRYRSLAYRLLKNYGLRPRVVGRVARRAAGDGAGALLGVLRGEGSASAWVGNGRDVVASAVGGGQDGLAARRADPTPRRNPNGVSARSDRVVARTEP
ncbi:MAG: glycosyltransferase family 2 protein [Halobacteriaceae archaeon]